jgi:branched-chain amino acid aminotransferase
VFAVAGRRVATPTAAACPEGITRAVVLELCAAAGIESEVRDVSLMELYRADEMFCTGTMGELAAVVRVDGRAVGGGEPGPVTAQLSALFADLTRRSGTPVVD